MNRLSYERLFGMKYALDSGVVRLSMLAILGAFLVAPVLFLALRQAGKIPDKQNDELWKRYRSWLILVPMMAIPVLLGAFWTIMAVGTLSILCYREYARATGLFRETLTSLLVALGILAITFSVLDHWYGLFTIFIPVYCFLIMPALTALHGDTERFLERIAAQQWAIMIAIYCVSHVPFLLFLDIPGFEGREVLLIVFLIVTVQGSDVLQYIFGKLFGKHRVSPNVSPSKTWEGLVGGLGSASLLGAALSFITPFTPLQAGAVAFMICALGFLGGLVASAIKRDQGVKDWGHLIEGHGGMLDRLD